MRHRGRVRSRSVVATAALTAALLGLVGCSAAPPAPSPPVSASGPAPVTSEQAELLGAFRFRNHAAGARAVNGQVVTREGDLALTGWVDFVARRGFARVSPAGADSAFLVVWDSDSAVILDGMPGDDPPPASVPDGTWTATALDAENGPLPRALLALLLLGSDRPDNPLLIRQGGAQYIGRDDLDGTTTDEFTGVTDPDAPRTDRIDDSTRYWLDGDGMLVQFGVRVDDVPELSVFRLTEEPPAPSIPSPMEVSG